MRKRIGIILSSILLATTFVGCSSEKGASVATSTIVENIKGQIEMRSTAEVTDELLSEMFYLNSDDVEEATVEKGQVNTGLETIAVVKAAEGKTDAVKEALEKVKEDKKASAFYPGEAEAVESAEIRVVGDYVGLFIIPDLDETGENYSKKAADIFEEALK